MTAFAFGAALPLVALGLASPQAMSRWRDRLLGGGKVAKILLGGVLIVSGVLIASGYTRVLKPGWSICRPNG